MRRRASAILIGCILVSSGCGPCGAAVGGAKVAGSGQAVVGQWLVVAIDGKPIPEGSVMSVDDRPDGQLIVESTGAEAPPLDQAWLKKMLDHLDMAGIFTALKVSGEGHEVEMKRKPGTMTISSG
jgi:hypothetical protein